MSADLNLFSGVEGFEDADNLVQSLHARKRGPYKTHHKTQEYTPYRYIQQLYTQLASFFPAPLFQTEENIFDYKGVIVWYSPYSPNDYEYNDKMYEGEQFQVIQAEITGTENFNINDRIALHKKLIELLEKRIELENAIKLIQQDVKEYQKKYELSEIAKWLKKQRT